MAGFLTALQVQRTIYISSSKRHNFCLTKSWCSAPLLHFLSDKAGPHAAGASRHPAGLGLNPSDRVPLPSISSPRCCAESGMRVGPAECTDSYIHPIQVHPEINLHKYSYLSSPGVWSGVFSLGPPLPYPKRHFCNSMQASELCQKALVSLKADLSFKVGASALGSTFPSAGTRNVNLFTCMCGSQYSQALMKPLRQFIKSMGEVVARQADVRKKKSTCSQSGSHVTYLFPMGPKRIQSIPKWVEAHELRLWGGEVASVRLPSTMCVWPLTQTHHLGAGSELWNPIPVRCVDSGTKSCSCRPRSDGHFADMTWVQRR